MEPLVEKEDISALTVACAVEDSGPFPRKGFRDLGTRV